MGKTQLLRPRRERYEVEHVDEPDLLRETFPYDLPPKLEFDGVSVPMDPPDEIFITCTTFRDGQQARPPYTVQQIVDLYDMMHRLGGPKGVIRQCEFFLYSEKDREAVEKCLEKGYEHPEVTGWIRAVKSDFQLVKDMGLKETGILTSSSDYHTFLKLGKGREGALEGYLDLVHTALETCDCIRCHFEDITRADFYGFIIPFAQRLVEAEEEIGKPIRIRLCDTMGYGLPFPEAAVPRGIPKMIHGLIHEAGVKKERLEWHGHNDFHKVLVNAEAAWLYGCAAANGTLLGWGERTGNPPIEGLVIEYIGLKGDLDGTDPTVITEIAEYFEKEIGQPIAPNYPFVGRNFNVTAAGIHADGVIKNEEIYNIFDTAKILNRPLGVNVTDKSGAAGVAFWVNHALGLTGDDRLDKRDPGVMKIVEWVDAQYEAKRTSSISYEEMLEQAKKHLPERFK
ncbi:MAG: 2-isopropylmalate synthase [Armatimonadota bacterium]